MPKKFLAFLVGVFIFASPLHALHNDQRTWGIYGSGLGDPMAVIGVNYAINKTDYWRVSGGLALPFLMFGIGVGTDFFFPIPFTPTFGLHAYHIFYKNDDTFDGKSLTGIYFKIGFEWQMASGLNMGMGFNMGGPSTTALPYIQVGWFFKY